MHQVGNQYIVDSKQVDIISKQLNSVQHNCIFSCNLYVAVCSDWSSGFVRANLKKIGGKSVMHSVVRSHRSIVFVTVLFQSLLFCKLYLF